MQYEAEVATAAHMRIMAPKYMILPTGGLCCWDGPPQRTLLMNGDILFTGGNDIGGSESSVELYDPAAGTFAHSKMSIARDGHSSTLLPDGTVLLAAGLAAANRSKPPVASAEIYNPTTGAFFGTDFLRTDELTMRLSC